MTDLEQLREDKKQVENAIHKLLFDFTEKYTETTVTADTKIVYEKSECTGNERVAFINVVVDVKV